MHQTPRSCLTAWPALLLLAACSGNLAGVPIAPQSIASRATHAATRANGSSDDVYICNLDKCFVFTSDGQFVRPVKKGLSLPAAVVSDPEGNVYVLDQGTSSIDVYAPGMQKRTATLSGIGGANDLAVHDGTIATGGGQVIPAGSSQPTSLNDPDVMTGNGIAFDSHGNCYWSVELNDGKGTFRVDEFTGCAGSPQPLAISGEPLWLAFDGNDNLYYADENDGIYRCRGVSDCSLAFARGHFVRGIRFDQGWRHLYAVEVPNQHSVSRIDIATGRIDETMRQHLGGYSQPLSVAAGPGPN